MRLEHLLSGEDLVEGFWYYGCLYRINREKDEAESNTDEVELNPKQASPIAQLVRALH